MFSPGFGGAVRGIKSKVDIFGIGAGKLCNVAPVHGEVFIKYSPPIGLTN
jgi:hypothetical protein